MDEFEDRFGLLINEVAGGNRSKFSELTEKGVGYANDIYKGRSKPSFDYLKQISKQFKISLDWLVSGKGSMHLGNRDGESNLVQIPRYDVQVSAGHGSLIEKEDIIDYTIFERKWIMQELKANPSSLALISVDGDSMAPTILSRDQILVDLSQNYLIAEGLFVIRIDDGLMVKRIQKTINGTIHVISDNPAYHSLEISDLSTVSLNIVGRVIWFGRNAR